MKKKENNKLLIKQLEQHAKKAKLLKQVRKVALALPNLKIIKVKGKEYLVIDRV